MDKKTQLPATQGFTPAIYDRLWSYIFRFLDFKDHAAHLGTNKQLFRAGTTPASWCPKLRFESEEGMRRAKKFGCVIVSDITLVDSDVWRVNQFSLFSIPESWIPTIGRFKIEATAATWLDDLMSGGTAVRNRFARMTALTSLELQKSYWCYDSRLLSRLQSLSLDSTRWMSWMLDQIRGPALTDLTLRRLWPSVSADKDADFPLWDVVFQNKQLKNARFEGFKLTGSLRDLEFRQTIPLEVLRLPGCTAVKDEFWTSMSWSFPLMPRLRELELPRSAGLQKNPLRSGDSLFWVADKMDVGAFRVTWRCICENSTELQFLSVPQSNFYVDSAAAELALHLRKLRVLRITDTISRVAAQVFLKHLTFAKRDCEGPIQVTRTDPTPALCEGVTVYWCR
jgi:hypothetical protein